MNELKSRTKIYTGNSNKKLAEKIAYYLSTRLSPIEIDQFSDGEIRCEIPDHVRGSYIYIIQSTCRPVNDNLMELLVMTDAFKRQGVERVTAIIPYYGYSRQDRKPCFTRTPITSKLVAKMLVDAGIDDIVTVDIHSEQQLGFFDIPLINISASPEMIADIWKRHTHDDFVIVSPDTGGVTRARGIAKQLDDADLAIIDKRRPKHNVSEVMNVIGDVEGRRCVIIDDMIDTAGTLCKAASALKEMGATYVAAYATHAVFSGNAFINIIDTDELDEVVITNTIPLTPEIKALEKVKTLCLSGILGETIRRLRSRKSVSEIYTGI